MGLPLGDIRVIDLTVVRAGPTCVRKLAGWGADVIRVEPPGEPAGDQAARDTLGAVGTTATSSTCTGTSGRCPSTSSPRQATKC
jgi:crotonobetainyl-CoA:carnitine CoA-transferase CaiB-like acyl-CoA transferase